MFDTCFEAFDPVFFKTFKCFNSDNGVIPNFNYHFNSTLQTVLRMQYQVIALDCSKYLFNMCLDDMCRNQISKRPIKLVFL